MIKNRPLLHRQAEKAADDFAAAAKKAADDIANAAKKAADDADNALKKLSIPGLKKKLKIKF